LVLLVAAAVAGCATYQVGSATLYPGHIRTVHVPVFESDSFRRNLGERLTEAVVKEIELRTPYKVVNDPNADSVLSGRIVGEHKRVLVNAMTGDPRELQVNLRVLVTWTDRQGRILRGDRWVPVPAEVTDVQGSANLVPEVGQSVATAHQQAIQRVARQIVDLLENPW
jgi:hypothetical protein